MVIHKIPSSSLPSSRHGLVLQVIRQALASGKPGARYILIHLLSEKGGNPLFLSPSHAETFAVDREGLAAKVAEFGRATVAAFTFSGIPASLTP